MAATQPAASVQPASPAPADASNGTAKPMDTSSTEIPTPADSKPATQPKRVSTRVRKKPAAFGEEEEDQAAAAAAAKKARGRAGSGKTTGKRKRGASKDKDLTAPPRKYEKKKVSKPVAGGEMKINTWTSGEKKKRGTKRKAVDPNQKHICSTCNKEFNDSSGLKKHVRIHGAKRFVCQVSGCGKAFVESSKLKRHMLVHTKERPFACNFPDCGKKFSLEYNLRSHMRVHTGEKPFKCEHPGCGKAFSQLSNLKTHKRLHDPDVQAERARKRSKRSSDPQSPQGQAIGPIPSAAPGIVIQPPPLQSPPQPQAQLNGGPGPIPARVVTAQPVAVTTATATPAPVAIAVMPPQ